MKLSGLQRPKNRDDIPTYALIPAFMISELKTAFTMGVALFIPFVVIDLVVASVLMSMGMIMLPPVMISLPLKIIVFVLADGWHLLTWSVVRSFQ
jgi:flagellar biosynthetic protein FliP